MEFKSKDFTDKQRVLKIRRLKVGLTGRPAAQPVLNEIDLDIRAGELTFLVGESGSGKTLLALCLMGMAPDSARLTGQLRIDGQDMARAAERDWQRLRSRSQSWARR